MVSYPRLPQERQRGLSGQCEGIRRSWCGGGTNRICCAWETGGKGVFEAYGLLAELLGVLLGATRPSSRILFLWSLCMRVSITEGCIPQTSLPGRSVNAPAFPGKHPAVSHSCLYLWLAAFWFWSGMGHGLSLLGIKKRTYAQSPEAAPRKMAAVPVSCIWTPKSLPSMGELSVTSSLFRLFCLLTGGPAPLPQGLGRPLPLLLDVISLNPILEAFLLQHPEDGTLAGFPQPETLPLGLQCLPVGRPGLR